LLSGGHTAEQSGLITDMRRQGLKGWTITSALRPLSTR
jgi:hypothetical protein